MGTSVDRRIKKSKKALKLALIELMAEREFHDISVTDIVGHADLNRGTFYKHYGYKEDLLHELIEDVMTDLVEAYRKPYKDAVTFDVSSLTASAIHIFQHVVQYAAFYKTALNPNVLPGFQQRMCDVLKELQMEDLLAEECIEGIDKELQASYFAYALLGLIMHWKGTDFSYSPAYMAEQLIYIIRQSGMKSYLVTNGSSKGC